MSQAARPSLAAYVAATAAVVAALVVAFTAARPLDYASPGCAANPLCDDAAPAINSLADGHVHQFFERQPLMGPVSLVLRAPFAALAGNGAVARYRAGLVPCLLALAALGAALARLAARRRRPWWFQLLVGLGAVVNPVTYWAVRFGHPEELLGGALLAAAALAAVQRRPVASGALAGLAIGTKLWALLALPVLVIVLMPRDWRRMAVVAAVTGVVLIGLPFAVAPTQFHHNLDALAKLGSKPGTVSRTDVWFPAVHPVTFLAPQGFDARGALVRAPVPAYDVPDWIGRFAHALIALVALGLAAFWWLRGRPGAPERALLLLAVVLLLRCILDPGTRSYYHAPFLLALLTYETAVRVQLPWLTVAGAAGIEGFSLAARHIHSDGLFGAAYVAWSVPLACVMALELVRRRRAG